MKQIDLNKQPLQQNYFFASKKLPVEYKNFLKDPSKRKAYREAEKSQQMVPKLALEKFRLSEDDLKEAIADENRICQIQEAKLEQALLTAHDREFFNNWLKSHIAFILDGGPWPYKDLEEPYLQLGASPQKTGDTYVPIGGPYHGFDDLCKALCDIERKVELEDFWHELHKLKVRNLELLARRKSLVSSFHVAVRLNMCMGRLDDLRKSRVWLRFHFMSDRIETPHSNYRFRARKCDTIETIIKQLPLHWQVSMDSTFIYPKSLCKFNISNRQIEKLEGWIEYFEAGGLVIVVG